MGVQRPDPHRLYVHLAWSCSGRSSLRRDRRSAVEAHAVAVCGWFGADAVEVLALPDRLHVLLKLPSGASVRETADHVRSELSALMAESGQVTRWAGSFVSATVGPSDLPRVRRRIAALAVRWEEASLPDRAAARKAKGARESAGKSGPAGRGGSGRGRDGQARGD
ncbi:MAG: transposase [Gemmatimonadetes bacterium]|nr:transposase [Gemmatimonadota bacterium]